MPLGLLASRVWKEIKPPAPHLGGTDYGGWAGCFAGKDWRQPRPPRVVNIPVVDSHDLRFILASVLPETK